MEIKSYQEAIPQFAIYPDAGTGSAAEMTYLILGLVSEAGEVADKWKKLVRDGTFDRVAFARELGDVFWYNTQLCSAIGLDVRQCLQDSVDKLSQRVKTNTITGSGDTREQEALPLVIAG